MSEKPEDAIDHWKSDRLSRKREADVVLDYVIRQLEARDGKGQPRSFVLNIDAPWGSGKTFFLQKLRAQMQAQGYLVAYINAWENDHADDPMLPILASIKEVLEKFVPQEKRGFVEKIAKTGTKIAVHAIKGAANQFAKKYLGEGFENISKEVSDGLADAVEQTVDALAEATIKEFDQRIKLIKGFREQLSQIISDLGKDNKTKNKFSYS